MYYGRCIITFPKKSQAKQLFKFEKLSKTIFQYIIHENQFFKFFPLQMLGIVIYVFGHQESIAAISLTLSATNGWFKAYMMYSC